MSQDARDELYAQNAEIHYNLADQFDAQGQTEIAAEHRRIADEFQGKIGISASALAVREGLDLLGSATAVPVGKGLGSSFRSFGNPLSGGVGYKSLDALKSALGKAGPGKVWHHIVEQCQGGCARSAFPPEMIHNTKNVVAVPREVNQKLANFYSSKVPGTNTRVRDWLNGKSFKEQYEYGRRQLEKAMKEYDKTQSEP
jgi:hypothetical protein